MSETIWLEQIDEALINAITEKIFVTNYSTGQKEIMTRNSVFVRKPDNDYKITTYPAISLYNTSNYFNDYRYSMKTDLFMVTKDTENYLAELANRKKPFDINYQIDFWSKTMSNMNEMVSCWLGNFYPRYNLNVHDMDGNIVDLNMFKTSGVIKVSPRGREMEMLDSKYRIFHQLIEYSIWAEVVPEENINIPLVKEVKIHSTSINLKK